VWNAQETSTSWIQWGSPNPGSATVTLINRIDNLLFGIKKEGVLTDNEAAILRSMPGSRYSDYTLIVTEVTTEIQTNRKKSEDRIRIHHEIEEQKKRDDANAEAKRKAERAIEEQKREEIYRTEHPRI
jgi:lipid A disaccharide synthetase